MATVHPTDHMYDGGESIVVMTVGLITCETIVIHRFIAIA